MYSLVAAFSRLSIGMLILRLVTNRYQKFIVYLALSVSTCACLGFFVYQFFVCKPYPHFWDRFSPGMCQDKGYIYGNYVQSACTIFADWILALMPVWILYNSKLSLKAKCFTSALLGLGILYVVVLGASYDIPADKILQRQRLYECPIRSPP